jgi:glycosyltransferase involved in cell wall biosynthesis
MEPKVSFIIPFYNNETTLDLCLSSITQLSSNGVPVEIICVDNNSTDESLKIAQQFQVNVVHASRQSPGAARNRGIDSARGEILVFVDADVVLDQNWLEEALRALETPWIDCVQSAIIPTGIESHPMTIFRKDFVKYKTNGKFHYLEPNERGLPLVNTSAFAVRTRSLKKANVRFEESLQRCEDYDFTLKLLFSGSNFAFLPETQAKVYDTRNFVSYLMRSFFTGHYGALVSRSWGWKGSPNLFKKSLDLNLSWKINFNLIFHAIGFLTGSVSETSLVKISRYRKISLQFKLYNTQEFILSPWTRVVLLEGAFILINTQDGTHQVIEGESYAYLAERL